MLRLVGDLQQLWARARRVKLRVYMLRWRLRGLRAARGAVIGERTAVPFPRHLELGGYAEVGRACVLKCRLGRIYIGESCTLAENCWISASKSVRIEAHVLIGPGCVITDADHGIAGIATIRYQPMNIAAVSIGEGAWLGASVTVTAGCRIGRHAVVGAGSVVTRDIPDYAIAMGIPAKVVGHRDEQAQAA